MAEYEIKSPEGAKYTAEQNLYDGADENSALIATVHEIPTGSAGNLWMRFQEKCTRLAPEFIVGVEPSRQQLQGVIYRYALDNQTMIQNDLRMRLGLMGLSTDILSSIEQEGKK